MKRRYKVLSLESPFDSSKEWWEGCVKEENRINPIFNRNGYYFDREKQIAWLEINGEAWLYDTKKDFQFALDHNEGNNRIHNDVFQAIGVIMSYHLADRKLINLYLIEDYMRRKELLGY